MSEKNFETRVTEAEERALEAIETIKQELFDLDEKAADAGDDLHASALGGAAGQLFSVQAAISTAAALARDYARREG